MVKSLVGASIVCLVVLLAACTPKHADTGMQTGYPINERPMYGGVEKTPAMLKADEKYITAILKEWHTREEGARQVSKVGWKYFSNGDISTAIKRFNQAWLLNDREYSAYWGFALVYVLRDQNVTDAHAMFEKALSLEPNQGNFYVEYGRFLEENKIGEIDKAIALSKQGVGMNPKLRDGYITLIRCHVVKGEVEQVRYWFEQGKAHNVFSPSDLERYESAITEVESI